MALAFLKLGVQALAGTAAAGTVAVTTGILPMKTVEGWYANFLTAPQVAALIEPQDQSVAKVELPKELVPKVEEAKPEPVEKAAVEPPKSPKPVVPKFDVLRVEKDGSVLVAGNGPANSMVELLMPDGSVVGETKSGPEGDFVIIPSKPLAVGDHVLTLQATPKSGERVVSAQSSIIHVPDRDGEVLAMISESGTASRIIAKPQQFVAKAPVAEPKEPQKEPVKVVVEKPLKKDFKSVEVPKLEAPKEKPVQVAKVETPQETATDAQVETAIIPAAKETKPEEKKAPKQVVTPAVKPVAKSVAKAPETSKPVVEKKPEPAQKSVAAQKPSAVVVEAVEVEGTTVFVAGAVRRGTPVRVYIDNKSLGVTKGTADNRFLIAKKFQLSEGEHKVRADVLDRKTGNVASRAEVPLVHEKLDVQEKLAPLPATPKPEQKPQAKPVVTANAEKELKKPIEVAQETKTKSVEKPVTPTKPTMVAKAEIKPVPKKPSVSTGVKKAETAQKEETKPVIVADDNSPLPAVPVPQVIRTGKAVIIKPGDNLWRISRKTYGRGIRYTTIYNANRNQIKDPSRIYIGQIFKIPDSSTQ